MAMIRVGDTVSPILEMHKVGQVVKLEDRKHSTMLIGGTLSTFRVALVKLQGHDELVEWRVRDIVRVD